MEYIVKNTIGEKLKSTKSTTVPNLKILDPACGSGSFLIGAYDYLLKFYLKFYTDKKRIDKALKQGKIFIYDKNDYHLSIKERQKILLENIYGVDIDEQAVEVTKLSLLLKLLEDESFESSDLLLKSAEGKW